jgi:nicotinamidase/pyrazinamidase
MNTVFFDVDTQFDFLYPAGALYVRGAEQIVPSIAKLNHFAVKAGNTLVSTVDAHPENDPEFLHWPPHCVKHTFGQQKPESTLTGGTQIIFPKVKTDFYHTRSLPELVASFEADRFVVYGVVTEICVRSAAFGLLETGARVELVTDAVRSLDEAKAAAMLQEFQAGGGFLTTVQDVINAA